jgi:thioester reductase-like protein
LGRYPDEVGLDTDFFALGGHSMQTAQVLLRVHKAFVLGAGALPLARFFATPTVRHMAQEVELARGMETVTGGTASSGAEATPHAGLHRAVVQVLPPKEDDDAEAAGRELRADAQLPDDLRQMLLASADVPYIVDPCGASGIFITGATGFLGTYLVDELLRLAPATRLYCLVRAPTIAAGRERLLAARRRYLLTDEATDPRLASALIPVLGDLSQPRLGLDEARWHQLAERVQLIYHCGAQVNFVLPYAQVRAANVLSTTDLLRLACSQPGLRPLHFVSTLSVFPPAGPHVPAAATAHGRTWYENDDLVGYEQALEGGYPQSKWVGERLVTRAGALGLPATIHRPGLITGHSRAGAWNTDDAMCRRLKSYIELGLVPSTGEPLAMTPVDYVAAAVVALTRQASSLGKAFHLTNAESITLPQLGAWCAAHGYPIQLVSPAQFRNAVLQAAEASPDQPLFPLLTALDEADAAPRGQDESANDPDLAAPSAAATQRFDCRNTRAGLASTEIGCPPLDETLLTTYFDFLVRSGYLPVPGSAGGRARDTHTE